MTSAFTISDARWRELIARDAPVILDVGANDGEDTLRFKGLFPAASLYCFEPDVRALRKLKALTGDGVEVEAAAVCATDGPVEFFASSGEPPDLRGQYPGGWDKSGSIRRPTGHLDMHPWCSFDAPTQVRGVRLDTWARRRLPTGVIDLIWADVQGAELDLIGGACETLRRTRYLYTEYSNIQLYAGQSSLDGIHAALPTGFEVAEVFRFDVLFRNVAVQEQEEEQR